MGILEIFVSNRAGALHNTTNYNKVTQCRHNNANALYRCFINTKLYNVKNELEQLL